MDQTFRRYFSVSNADRRWGMYVTSAGRSMVPAGANYPQPDHPEGYHFEWSRGRVLDGFALIFISGGEGVFQSRSATSQSLSRGDMLLLPPGLLHRYRPTLETGWEEYWVTFDGTIPRSWHVKGLFAGRWPLLTHNLPPSAIERFADLLSVARQATYSPQLLASLTQTLLFSALSSSGAETSSLAPETRLRQAAERVCRHPMELGVQDLADLAGMPLSTFRRAFSDMFGLAPAKYIQHERIALAKKWLSETQLTVREIAVRMGYSSEFYFMRSFKKETGRTPGQWRASNPSRKFR